MAGNTFNITGHVRQGAVDITTGYVRVQNINKPSIVALVAIGQFEDGTLEAARYDAWFRAQEGNPDVVAIDDVFELKVFGTLGDATNNINPLFAAKQTTPITEAQFNVSYLTYELEVTNNVLPGLPEIRSEDYNRYANNRTQYWVWVIPSDSDGDSIHFQLEWSTSSEFPAGSSTHLYDTTKTLDRSFFSYETSPGVWNSSFPSSGVPASAYGKKCRFRITTDADGVYYWRVRATDAIDR